MRCFYFIVLQAIAPCIALPTWSPDSNYAIQTPKTGNINEDPSLRLHDVKLSHRGITKNYEVAQAAVPTQLIPGAYYFFMNCETVEPGYRYGDPGGQYVVDKVGCKHVGVVFGQVSESGNDFVAWYLHPKVLERRHWEGDVLVTDSITWSQSQRQWYPKPGQKLMYDYGGPTTAEKADDNKVWSRGQDWLWDAQHKFDKNWNCLKYYLYLREELAV
ncbi:hypothetical protein LY78DRAFT_675247 [Colletotrichum sublineola]|uniref:Uncharacterized protein n=1 Tax=Colletotrichum sublineola TaxID=1173701 RepID=A0A066XKW7_COLSU|nr:hypothetical protein LY78DRAFT_675247 [Colletotrichum sublineola]KDN69833.1 hypothetical protein CSUB01_12273 [Colletotrichum sublineola]